MLKYLLGLLPWAPALADAPWRVDDCNNLGTCWLTIEQSDASPPAAIRLEAPAGAPLRAEVVVARTPFEMDGGDGSLRLVLNGRPLEAIALNQGIGLLSPAAASWLLAAGAAGGLKLELQRGDERWTLSSRNSAEAVAQFEERRRSFPSPLPTPRILAAPVGGSVPTAPQEQLAALLRPLREQHCDADKWDEPIALQALNENYLLALTDCWAAPYNSGQLYVQLSRDLRRVIGMVGGRENQDYEDGLIRTGGRGRATADCGGSSEYVWDGRTFVLSSRTSYGPCNGLAAGGALFYDDYVSEVVRAPAPETTLQRLKRFAAERREARSEANAND